MLDVRAKDYFEYDISEDSGMDRDTGLSVSSDTGLVQRSDTDTWDCSGDGFLERMQRKKDSRGTDDQSSAICICVPFARMCGWW